MRHLYGQLTPRVPFPNNANCRLTGADSSAGRSGDGDGRGMLDVGVEDRSPMTKCRDTGDAARVPAAHCRAVSAGAAADWTGRFRPAQGLGPIPSEVIAREYGCWWKSATSATTIITSKLLERLNRDEKTQLQVQSCEIPKRSRMLLWVEAKKTKEELGYRESNPGLMRSGHS